MLTVTLSRRYQFSIPKALRDTMGLKAGEKMAVFQRGEKIELVRIKQPKELAGSLKGLKNTFKRDGDRSL